MCRRARERGVERQCESNTESESELEAAGLRDWLAPGALVLVEWADRCPEALPRERLTVRFAPDAEDGEGRELRVRARGREAEGVLERWAAGSEAAACR